MYSSEYSILSQTQIIFCEALALNEMQLYFITILFARLVLRG